MLPSCRQVAEQLSEDIDGSITGLKWLKLKLHLMMCKYCRLYGRQIALSVRTINLLEPKIAPSESFKEEMLQRYRDCHCENHKAKKKD